MVDKIRVVGNLLFILVIGGLVLFLFNNSSRDAQITANVILNEQSNGTSFNIRQGLDGLSFDHSRLNYRLSENCSERNSHRIRDAFFLLSEHTNLSFHESNYSIDIEIICLPLNEEFKNDTLKLAEGGPTLITGKEILEGKIILYDSLKNELNCSFPVSEVHELLHVLGFSHTLRENSVLYPIGNCEQIIDEEIIDKIKALYP